MIGPHHYGYHASKISASEPLIVFLFLIWNASLKLSNDVELSNSFHACGVDMIKIHGVEKIFPNNPFSKTKPAYNYEYLSIRS